MLKRLKACIGRIYRTNGWTPHGPAISVFVMNREGTFFACHELGGTSDGPLILTQESYDAAKGRAEEGEDPTNDEEVEMVLNGCLPNKEYYRALTPGWWEWTDRIFFDSLVELNREYEMFICDNACSEHSTLYLWEDMDDSELAWHCDILDRIERGESVFV